MDVVVGAKVVVVSMVVLCKTVIVGADIMVVGINVDPWVVLDSIVLVGAPSYNNP